MDSRETNPWPAIRELQDIVKELNGYIAELQVKLDRVVVVNNLKSGD